MIQSWMFPLRVVTVDGSHEIWTKWDDAMGSRNNFAILGMIQHIDDAQRICDTLNANMISLCRE